MQFSAPTLRPIHTLVDKNMIAFENPLKPAYQNPTLARFLPRGGVVTIILDQPYSPLGSEEVRLSIQNTFLPLLLNPYPEEDLAIVFCSTDVLADKRLAEMNYKWIQKISAGKGVAKHIR